MNSIKTSFYMLIVALLILMSACDTFEEDQVVEAQKIEQAKAISILPNTTAIIDFKKLVKINDVVSTRVSKSLQYGELNKIGDELFKYTPRTNTIGTEIIEFNVYGKENNFLFTDELRINITTSFGDSCFLQAIQDEVYAAMDSIKVIDVLANDYICDSVNVDIAIIKMPDYGSAHVKNNKTITYKGVMGQSHDEFVYRLTVMGDSTLSSDALVIINPRIDTDTCLFLLEDDYADYSVGTSYVQLDVLANDQVCNDSVFVELVGGPYLGQADFSNDNLLTYYPPAGTSSHIDSLTYRACAGNICDVASVVFEGLGSCNRLIAHDDYFDIPDSVSTGPHYIDVVANDEYCEFDEIRLVVSPSYGTAGIDNGMIFYVPDPQVAQDDEMVYELYSSTWGSDTAVVIINRIN